MEVTVLDEILFDQEFKVIENQIRKQYDINTRAFILNRDVVKLISLLGDEKIDKMGSTLIPNLLLGELSLCADKWDGYSESSQVSEIVTNSSLNKKSRVIQKDFLEAEIKKKYKSIILCPPFGERTEYGRSEVAYIEKCLNVLDKGGRMVVLVPQNITSAHAFKSIRERIIRSFSLDAVITVKRISRATGVECSLIVIENGNQKSSIYMTLGGKNAIDTYNDYRNGVGGFYVDASDVYDRFDASYFDPQYKEIRNLVQNRDTVKLGELADVFTGCIIPPQERKEFGEYLVIKPQYIYGREVNLGNERKVFCSKEHLKSDPRGQKCLLKNGDVLISTTGEINWAIYSGDDDFAIANQHVAIIRGRKNSEKWLRLFFTTNTGIEYLESQLKFFSHCGVFNHISTRSLVDMAVPDLKMMKVADNVMRGRDLEAKVTALFRDLGWDVREQYGDDRLRYDIALFFNGKLKGIVEVKSYNSKQIRNNHLLASQLERYKENVNGASLYLFVNDEIFEYIDGKLEQLTELPRPDRRDTKKKTKKYSEEIITDEVLKIEKSSLEETSLTDKLLFELVTRDKEIMLSLNRIEGKVDNIVAKIEQLSKQISGYQSLVEKQLDMAVTPEEEERIIHAFSEECAERMIGEFNAKIINREYSVELQKLVLSFEKSAWEKMEESSRTFLVSSKLIFNNLIGLHDIVDYSGVCLLITKALEVEMAKRFCKNFLTYLKNKYPGKVNYSQFPTGLLDRYGKPIKPKHFTLGSVAYVLCYLKADEITEEQSENNKNKLLEYSKEKLFSGKSDDEIIGILSDYAESVEEIKNDYRNPSAHTNELKRVDAEQCFALVIDVEKLMKKMLDSFDE